MQGVSRGLAAAAKDRGLDYRVALANNDGARMIEQVQALRAAKVGAVVAAPVDPLALSPQPAAGHLGRRLCRHRRAAAGDLAAQRAAISDRQGARRCGGRLHPRRARRQGEGRAADARQPPVPRAALRRHARRAEGHPRRDHRRRHLADDGEQGGRHRDDAHHPAGAPDRRRRARRRHGRARRARGAARGRQGAARPVPRRHRRRAGGGRRDQEGRRPLQGERQPGFAGVRLCDGAARGRLARRQEHPAGDGHPAERAQRSRTSRNTRPIWPTPARSTPIRRGATRI